MHNEQRSHSNLMDISIVYHCKLVLAIFVPLLDTTQLQNIVPRTRHPETIWLHSVFVGCFDKRIRILFSILLKSKCKFNLPRMWFAIFIIILSNASSIVSWLVHFRHSSILVSIADQYFDNYRIEVKPIIISNTGNFPEFFSF